MEWKQEVTSQRLRAFFLCVGPTFSPHIVSRRLSVFTTLIRSEDKGLLGFRCPVDLVSFAFLLNYPNSGSQQGPPGGSEEEDDPVSEASRRNLHNTFAGQPCEGKLAFRGKSQPSVPSVKFHLCSCFMLCQAGISHLALAMKAFV